MTIEELHRQLTQIQSQVHDLRSLSVVLFVLCAAGLLAALAILAGGDA